MEVKTAVDSQVNTQIKGNAFNTCYNTSIEFANGDDLHLSVGKANITTSVMDMPGHYFDFDGIRDWKIPFKDDMKDVLSNDMNNVGYILQNAGIIHSYNWDYSYGYVIKK